MIWFCNIITADLCEKLNPKKSLSNFQKLAKPSKKGVCELVFCFAVLGEFQADL